MKKDNQREVEKLLPLIQLGDIEARNKVVEMYIGLVKSINKQLGNSEDGEQEGVLGLIRAITNYDPKKSKFSTYSYKYIYFSIKKHINTSSIIIQLKENIAIENESIDALNLQMIIEKYCNTLEINILNALYEENLTYTNAAKALGMSKKELKDRLFIALKKIKMKL